MRANSSCLKTPTEIITTFARSPRLSKLRLALEADPRVGPPGGRLYAVELVKNFLGEVTFGCEFLINN